MSPHQARYGKELPLYLGQYELVGKSEQGIVTAEKWKYITESLKEDIQFQNLRRRSYYNANRQAKPSLKRGDKAYILSRNIRTKRPNKKLDYKKLGPYKILEEKKGDTFKLELPPGTRIYDTFHVSLLEPAPRELRLENKETTPGDTIQVEPEWEVEKILGSEYQHGQLHYLLKWKYFADEENSWEPAHLLSCPRLISQYHRLNPTATR
jgi:hypothetical protein